MPTTHPDRDIRERRAELEARARRAYLTVVLLGKGGSGLEERRGIARILERAGMNVVIPEDDLPPEMSPSLAEEQMLVHGDMDLVFLNVDSWGSATEFGQMQDREPVARKLRILVSAAYHPLYGDRGGYLTDLYLTHLAVFGHVYSVGRGGESSGTPVQDVVVPLASRFSEMKLAKPWLTK